METIQHSTKADSELTADPVVGVPSHPVAAATGAVATAVAAGAVIGTAAGPVGTAVGAIVGAVVGGLGGDAIASAVEEAHESTHWRENYSTRPYVKAGSSYDDYGPAYNYGEHARRENAERSFEEVSPELETNWDSVRGRSPLQWHEAEPAARDAWERFGNSFRNKS